MTTNTLYLPCHPLYLRLHPVYLFHQTQCINYTTPCSLDDITHIYIWHHVQYAWHHINSLWHHTTICMISHPVHLWHGIHIMDAFMTTQRPYLTSHPLYLTSQALYLYHHTHDTHICIDVSLFRWHHNKYGSHHTCHLYDIIHTLHDITLTLYEINDQYSWHNNHCIHDIRFPLYDITSTVYDILSPIPVTSEPLYLKITPTMGLNSYPLYLTSNTAC